MSFGTDSYVSSIELAQEAHRLGQAPVDDDLAVAQLEATLAQVAATHALIELLAMTVPTMMNRSGLKKLNGVADWQEVLKR